MTPERGDHSEDTIIVAFRRRFPVVARHIGAAAMALVVYVIAALCVGWLTSIALTNINPVWPRFLAEATVSTCAGMLVSWRLTTSVFPNQSGRLVVATFASVTAVSLIAALADDAHSLSWLQGGQSLLLVALAYGLFWPHRRSGT